MIKRFCITTYCRGQFGRVQNGNDFRFQPFEEMFRQNQCMKLDFGKKI